VAVAGQVEQDGLRLAGRLAASASSMACADGVAGLRRRDDAFGAGELHAGLEGGDLRHGQRLDQLSCSSCETSGESPW
jgi:hypothetical protein